jgi:DNA helicase-2/ATP-dependent DNA helicase PcrA
MAENTEVNQPLNNEQQQVVSNTDAPACVIAIPGSGKTKTITHKIVKVLDANNNDSEGNPVRSKHVMAITFTNAAAQELKERTAKLVSAASINRLNTGTFHGIFGQALRRINSRLMQRKPASEQIAEDYMDRAIKKYFSEKIQQLGKNGPKELLECIKKVRSEIHSPCGMMENKLSDDTYLNLELAGECIEFYKNTMNEAKLRDQDMTLEETLKFLKTKGNIERSEEELLNRKKFFEDNGYNFEYIDEVSNFVNFHHLFVDEAQDMDRVQLEIILELHNLNVIVDIVGDDDQSIYGFRHGLGYLGMQEFIKRSDAKKFFLQKNYRCKSEIIQLAGQIIEQNDADRRMVKELIGARGSGGEKTVTLDEFETESYELHQVSLALADQIRGSSNIKIDSAVISRTKLLLNEIEADLTSKEVVYKRLGSDSIWETEPNAYFMQWLDRLVSNAVGTGIVFKEIIKPFELKKIVQESDDLLLNLKAQFFATNATCRKLLNANANANADPEEVVILVYKWFLNAMKTSSKSDKPNSAHLKLLKTAAEVLVGSDAIKRLENPNSHDQYPEAKKFRPGLTQCSEVKKIGINS